MEKQPLIPASAEAEPSIQDLQSRVEEARTTAMTAQRDLFSAQQNYSQAWARTPRGRIFRTIFFTFLIALFALPLSGLLYLGLTDDDEVEEYLPRRIPLEAHIMSKCPDARDCLHDLVLPAMVNVSHLVDFKLSYIGTYVPCLFISPHHCCLLNTLTSASQSYRLRRRRPLQTWRFGMSRQHA